MLMTAIQPKSLSGRIFPRPATLSRSAPYHGRFRGTEGRRAPWTNLYAYVGNDPMNAVDPSGQDKVTCIQVGDDAPICHVTDDGSNDVTLAYINQSIGSDGTVHTSGTITRTFSGSKGTQVRAFNRQVSNLCNCNNSPILILAPRPTFTERVSDVLSAITGGRIGGGIRGRGANANDRKTVDYVARSEGVDRRAFGKFVEHEKKLLGKRGDENFSVDELRRLAREFKNGAR